MFKALETWLSLKFLHHQACVSSRDHVMVGIDFLCYIRAHTVTAPKPCTAARSPRTLKYQQSMKRFNMKQAIPLLLSYLILSNAQLAQGQAEADFQYEQAISKVTFGACFNPRMQKPAIFDGILKQDSAVFVFIGDNIYGDTTDMELLKRKWGKLEAVEGFRQLRDSTTLLATWDDHDYGVNDGGKSYAKREESEAIFLDFFKDPQDSPRRQREGVYGSYVFGPAGQRCQIILLDTRYFRDELPHTKAKKKKGTVGWYEPTEDRSKTLLGEAQWAWLEAQLQVPADIRILASSIQVLAQDKGMENWGNVPHEQARLFELIKKHKAHHTFAISGDVHFSELSQRDIDGYSFYDFTSSGMSHTSKGWANCVNPYRVGKAIWEHNAGLIEIDWAAESIQLSAINSNGDKLFTHQLAFAALKVH
jgi:alkaline phosphatase D